MTQFTPRKSSPRLSDFPYRGHHGYFVAINTADRQRELVGEFAETCAGTLLESAAKSSFEAMAYCLMPITCTSSFTARRLTPIWSST